MVAANTATSHTHKRQAGVKGQGARAACHIAYGIYHIAGSGQGRAGCSELRLQGQAAREVMKAFARRAGCGPPWACLLLITA